MAYKYVFTNEAQRDFQRLDKPIAMQILQKLNAFLLLKDPMEKAKKLRGFAINTYRFRIGDYRAIFRRNDQTGELVILVILKISHRKEVYKKLHQ